MIVRVELRSSLRRGLDSVLLGSVPGVCLVFWGNTEPRSYYTVLSLLWAESLKLSRVMAREGQTQNDAARETLGPPVLALKTGEAMGQGRCTAPRARGQGNSLSDSLEET